MNNIRGQRRWSLLPGTTDGLMMIALNGAPIGEFNVQRFSIKWIRDLGHLRCDDFNAVGQPHSKTDKAPTTENSVDPTGDGPEIPDLVRTFDHVYDNLGNVYADPKENYGNVYVDPNEQFGNVYADPKETFGNVYADHSDVGNVQEDSYQGSVEGSGSEGSHQDSVQGSGRNLGLTPEKLDETLDGAPKCKRRRVDNDELDIEEFDGTPMELMRMEIRKGTPYRFHSVENWLEFLRESTTLDSRRNEVADMTKNIIELYPVKQLAWTQMAGDCFFWAVYSQLSERPELGFPQGNILNPWELRHFAGEAFLRLYDAGYSPFEELVTSVLADNRKYGNNFLQYYEIQREKGDYADQPFIYALAWFLDIDIFILEDANHQSSWVRSSLDGTVVNHSKPPMILGLVDMHYQSFAPLKGAGMSLEKRATMPDWPGKKRVSEE